MKPFHWRRWMYGFALIGLISGCNRSVESLSGNRRAREPTIGAEIVRVTRPQFGLNNSRVARPSSHHLQTLSQVKRRAYGDGETTAGLIWWVRFNADGGYIFDADYQLSDQLQTGEVEKQYDAAKGLDDLGEEAKAATPALAQAPKSSNKKIRYRAAKSLSKIGEGAAPAVPQLAICLKDENPKTRYYAAKALSKVGSAAAKAIAELKNALRDSDAKVRMYAAKAIYESDTSSADLVPALIEALKDEDADVKYYAAGSLGHIGPKASRALPALKTAAQTGNDRLKNAVEDANRKIRSANLTRDNRSKKIVA